MENFKINYNQNKIISKLPNSFIHKQTIKTSNGLVGNQTKTAVKDADGENVKLPLTVNAVLLALNTELPR